MGVWGGWMVWRKWAVIAGRAGSIDRSVLAVRCLSRKQCKQDVDNCHPFVGG
jgi:hypothetical protein